jgi:hypothetical protein
MQYVWYNIGIPVYSSHFSLHFDSISCAKTWTMDVHRPGFSTCPCFALQVILSNKEVIIIRIPGIPRKVAASRCFRFLAPKWRQMVIRATQWNGLKTKMRQDILGNALFVWKFCKILCRWEIADISFAQPVLTIFWGKYLYWSLLAVCRR